MVAVRTHGANLLRVGKKKNFHVTKRKRVRRYEKYQRLFEKKWRKFHDSGWGRNYRPFFGTKTSGQQKNPKRLSEHKYSAQENQGQRGRANTI